MRSERRSAQRVALGCEVECEGPHPDPIRPQMRDLSATGAFVNTTTAVAVGTRLVLRLKLPKGELVLEALVARTTPEGCGVQFVEVSASDQAVIDDAVARAERL